MPDFEALIKHQQSYRSSSADRLKIVEPIKEVEAKLLLKEAFFYPMFFGFLGGMLGSIVSTSLLMISYYSGWINYEFVFKSLF